MSNIYIQEPPTNGKVLLHTTVGDIDIELWSKETPKACRNFVQLCLEGYYDKTKFHRLIKGFIVQGGDPNGDGTGGESIYGQPFKDEFHSRLRFVRRGLVAMANSGKDDNTSQFFFTLNATPELQNKNTIFGKVTGDTLYNMLKLEEGMVDQDDTPLYPHKIISTQVLSNPFPDIVPRVLAVDKSEPEKPQKPKEKLKKNFQLLSFGEEAEEDDVEMDVVNEAYKGQSKSSHDLIDDPRLSSVPAVDQSREPSSSEDGPSAAAESIRKKFEKVREEKANAESKSDENLSKDEKSLNKRKEVQKQIKELQKELKKKKKTEATEFPEKVLEEEPKEPENDVLESYHQNLEKYAEQKKKISKKGTAERQEATMKMFAKFRSTLEKKKEEHEEDEPSPKEDEEDDSSDTWLVHCMRANDDKVILAKDANMPSTDRYDISDPRNPMAERRRSEKRKKH